MWFKGIWDLPGGPLLHSIFELDLGSIGLMIAEIDCSPLDPKDVAIHARSIMTGYNSVLSSKTGYEGLVYDFLLANHGFFIGIGKQQAVEAGRGVCFTWGKALEGFELPSNCKEEPAGGCGDCGGGSCPNPGGDYPDDTASVSTLSSPPTSEDFLEQAWDRMAVKKNKKSLVWYQMQEYLLGELYQGNIDDQTYQMLSGSYGLTADEASELFYEDYITSPDVAILGRGFALAMSDLLQNKFYEPIRRFTVDDFSPDALKDYPILIIPSGGLMGLEKSDIFKVKLDEYVKNGGTLIVFAQQQGYEFSVLPVPQEEDGTFKQVSGYGWTEDQSCFYGAAYIDTWHQILAGQNKSTPNFHMDGYFTNYPSNTTIILRRTANGQPALLIYEYGQGKVIVTSMYSDFALKQNQASSDEMALVRDMISWVKKPDQLPEIKPGQSMTVSVSVTNNATNDASSLKVLIYNPDRTTLLSEQTATLSIPAGQSATIPVTYPTTQGSTLGIYHIDYTLYDSSGVIIQPQTETDSGRFVVSNPPANPYKSPDFSFSVQSENEQYIYGTPATFTFFLWNHTDLDRQIRVTWGDPHHACRYYYWYEAWYNCFNKTVTVPAKGATSFTHIIEEVKDLDMLRAKFYDEVGNVVGYAGKGIYMVMPSAKVTVATDKNLYAKGETVTINASLKNNTTASWQPNVKITVSDSTWTEVFEDTKALTLPPSGTGSVSSSFTLPANSPIGSYWVYVQVPLGKLCCVGVAYTRFELPQSQISVSPNLPTAFSTGPSTIPFILKNSVTINVSSGTIDLSLRAPDGSEVFSGNQPFSIAVGESKTLDVAISIPSLKLGNYTLTYSQSDETRIGRPVAIFLSNSYNLNLSLDKPAYKIGETANVTASIINTGKFLQEASLTMDVPFLGLSETRSLTLNPSETANIPYSLSLPLTLKQGGPVQVALSLPSGDRIEKQINLAIKPVKIDQKIVFDKASYRIRENLGINYIITNDGNFASPLNVSFTLSVPDLNYTHEGSLILEPLKDAAIPFTMPIPETILAGLHNVNVVLTLLSGTQVPMETGFVIPESSLTIDHLGTNTPRPGDTISLTIENTGGVDTTYSTGQLSIIDGHGVEIYHGNVTGTILSGEKKTLVDIQIPPQAVNGPAYLNVRVQDSKTWKTADYNKPIEIEGLTASLQARTDRDVYLITEAITGISSISNGELAIEDGSLKVSVSKISHSATGEFSEFLPKQGVSFSYPGGVAVGPDGSVYVADTENHRIQKFDQDGNFIMKWGSEGSGDKQFKYPYGIAIGPDGSVYVADYENNRIQKFDSNGEFITKWGSYCTTDTNGDGVPDQPCDGQFNYPEAIAIGPDGSIYVADDNHRVQKFDGSGSFITKWGSYCNTDMNNDGLPDQACDGQFYYPYGIAIGSEGSVYVADTSNHRIQKFDSNGNFITKWGSFCNTDPNGDGLPDQSCDSQFYYPWALP